MLPSSIAVSERISASRGSGRAGLAALSLLLFAADGCGSHGRKAAWELGFGTFATDLTVARIVPRGDYLDVTLVGHGLSLDAYTPRSEACSQAVLPNDPVCQGALAGGVASMEYRPAGRTTLSLVGTQGLCPIIGMILPLAPATGTPETP